MFHRFLADRAAATAIEYGLIAALIAIAAITAMGSLGNQVGNTMNKSATVMSRT